MGDVEGAIADAIGAVEAEGGCLVALQAIPVTAIVEESVLAFTNSSVDFLPVAVICLEDLDVVNSHAYSIIIADFD